MGDNSERENKFTFTWTIKNFAFAKERLISDTFEINNHTEWNLELYYSDNDLMVDLLCNDINSKKTCITMGYSISIFCENENVENIVLHCHSCDFSEDEPVKLTMINKAKLFQNRKCYLPDGNLTIQCLLWNPSRNWLRCLSGSAVSEIDFYYANFLYKLEHVNFRKLISDCESSDNSSSEHSWEINPFILSLIVNKSSNEVSMKISNSKETYLSCRLEVVDSRGVILGGVAQAEHLFQTDSNELEFSVPELAKLINNTDTLPKLDELSMSILLIQPIGTLKISRIHFEGPTYYWKHLGDNHKHFLRSIPTRSQCVNEIEGFQNSSINSTENNVINREISDFDSKVLLNTTISTLVFNFKILFVEKKFNDCVLKVGETYFPVHKTILYCRSPVFQRMFETDMKEKRNQCAEISDVELDTMRAMLDFLYLDKFEATDYDHVMKLFRVADTYQILDLKEHCKLFFKRNLNDDNICDVLLLAELYSDDRLKDDIQNYILTNPNIFTTWIWSEFAENNLSIASKVMQNYFILKSSSTASKHDIEDDKLSIPESSLFAVLTQAYRNGNFCDCDLLVGGCRFSVHSIVLHARSSVLSALVESVNYNETNIKEILLKDSFNPEAIQNMIEFMYFDTVENIDFHKVVDLFSVSIEFQFQALRDTCVVFLKQNLTISNVLDALVLADSHEDCDLKDAAETFILGYRDQMLRLAEWRTFYEKHRLLAGAVMMKYFSSD